MSARGRGRPPRVEGGTVLRVLVRLSRKEAEALDALGPSRADALREGIALSGIARETLQRIAEDRRIEIAEAARLAIKAGIRELAWSLPDEDG